MGPLGKLRKILEKPEMPAHMKAQQYVHVPWTQRFLDLIRPPSVDPAHRAPMTRSQARMVWIPFVLLIIVIAVWGTIDYISGAPGRARVAFEDGMRAVGANDFKSAVDSFTRSLSISQTAEAYLQRGNANASLGKNEEAIADWTRAIDHDPTLAEAYAARATYYRRTGQFDKAIPDLDTAIRLTPSVDAFYQRGQVYAEMRQYKRAIEDYDRAILERREAPYVYLARSAAKRELGDEEGYRADQAKATELRGR